MSKSAWGNIGAWAADTEREEAEEREAAEKAAADAAAAQPTANFPSLKEAVTTGKQKKKTKMTLQEFTMQQPGHSGSRLTPEEMLRLPTGPNKERSPDEMQHGRPGGGFPNYGSRTGSVGFNTGRAREYESRRSHGLEDDARRGTPSQSRVSEFDQPSRADEVDNWASRKKQTLPEYNTRAARPGPKYSSLGGGGGAGVPSRADEVDNWASVKKPISQTQQQTRSSSFGTGFSRSEPDRRARNENFGSGFSRPEPDRWTRNEQKVVSSSLKNEVAEAVKVDKPNPFGVARPREEVLAEKGLDWKKLDLEFEAKKQQHSVSGESRPTSSQSSRPESPHSSRSEAPAALVGNDEGVPKQKPRVNPFGDAKPREVLLEEKGLDWKKIDLELEHRGVDRPETEEEKNLKEEIEHLKKELLQKSGEDQASMRELILKREQDLELLVRQLDDKVRYSQRNSERQSSGAVRGPGFNDRPPSRTGLYDERRTGFHDRPPSAPGPYEEPRAGYQERPLSRPGVYEDSTAGFSERPPSRPGTYEDPQPGFAEGPPSQPGAYEDSRSGFHDRSLSSPGAYEEVRYSNPQRSSFTDGAHQEPRAQLSNERPPSRGTLNSWTRSSDDRRYFQGGGGRGFSGSRDVDRSGSRW